MAEATLSEVITFSEHQGTSVTMTLYAPAGTEFAMQCLAPSEAAEFGEEQIQILEGLRYEYELSSSNYRLREENGGGIVVPSTNPHLAHCGMLVTGLNAGKLILQVTDVNGMLLGTAALEIRPKKLGHRDHYRLMLEDITEVCVGLAMELRSPTSLKVMPSLGNSSSSIHQRFAFLRALIGSQTFRDALHRISTHPHRRWEAEEQTIDVRRGFRANARTMREIAKAQQRVPIHAKHPLSSVLVSVPERISTYRSAQTTDTQENRFVKFALESFVTFLRRMRGKLEALATNKASRGLNRSETDSRLLTQISTLEGHLVNSLSAEIFRNLPNLETLPFGSPVLQRMEGYREIFQSWIKFDMAARLTWTGGDDVYGAGQRDIATLYEYWVFFKLLAIVSNYFKLTSPLAETLLEPTEDGFGIKLKSGEHLAFDATRIIGGRSLNVQFGYNRSFGGNTKYPSGGSWTERMRPDYTLSLWPSEFCTVEAERQEMMVHIHFDAKYRVDDLQEIFGNQNNLSQPKTITTGNGKYKRDDLLKMHAYRDAIRRTHGAYVIYPGDVQKGWEEFNEILPGLGAFPLRPGSDDSLLTTFIDDVVHHVCDRATQRERRNFHHYRVYKEEKSAQIHLPLPELDNMTGERLPPPSETCVLISSTHSINHFNWALQNGIFGFYIGAEGTNLRIDQRISTVCYLLICAPGLFPITSFVKIRQGDTRILSGAMLEALGCPDIIKNGFYLGFDIDDIAPFGKIEWDLGGAKIPDVLTLDSVIKAYLKR